MTWDNVTPLLGVLLGGVIVAGSNYLLERTRWRREDAARRRTEERELRRAARIVLEEPSQLGRLVKRVAQTGRYWPKESPAVRGWAKYQDALAADVSDETWRRLTTAYDGIIQFNDSAAKGRAEANVGQVGFSAAGLASTRFRRDPWRDVVPREGALQFRVRRPPLHRRRHRR